MNLTKVAERLDQLAPFNSQLASLADEIRKPIPMVLHCPECGLQHVDRRTAFWSNPPHRSHLCEACGHIWRPADVATVGVECIQSQGLHDSPIRVRNRAP